MHVALSIPRYLHIDPRSSVTVKVIRVESIIARDLVSSWQTTEIHPNYNVDTGDQKVSVSVMSIVVGIDFKIDDFISLTTDVFDILRTVLYPLLQDW